MTAVVLTQPKEIDRFLRGFISNPRAAVGLGLVTLAMVFAVGAPIFAPFAPDQLDFITILAPRLQTTGWELTNSGAMCCRASSMAHEHHWS